MRGAPHVGFPAAIRKIRSRTSFEILFLPTTRGGLGDDSPIERESQSVPAHNGLGVHNNKRLFPSGPVLSCENPEELVEYCESWPGTPSLQCRELLAKSKVFKEQHASGEKQAKDRAKQESEGVCHATLLRHFACEMQCCIPLKSKADRILANDKAAPKKAEVKTKVGGKKTTGGNTAGALKKQVRGKSQ